MAKYNRRDFIKVCAATGATVAVSPELIRAMELGLGGKDFHQLRTFHVRKRKNYLCTLCPYFDGGFTFAEDGEIKKTEGNPDHIATRGKFCSKGISSFLSAYDPDRIVAPQKRVGPRGSGRWKRVSWNEAIREVAQKVKEVIDNNGANQVYLNEGSFKESPCVRFMNTIGSESIVRSRFPSISNAAKEAALQRMLGVDFALPDLENTKYVLNFGANIMETAFPLAQRLTDGMVNKKLKLVTFDVRMSNTAGRSDEWIPVFPGTDGLMALAMANVIMSEGLADRPFIDKWTNYSSDRLAEHLGRFSPEMAAKASGVPAGRIRRIAREFATTKPATLFSQNGVTYHQNGIYGEMACNLLPVITGNIDVKGGYCLPRRFKIGSPEPALESQVSSRGELNHLFPFKIKEGSAKVGVLFNHMSNPAYTAPASSIWRQTLKDEKLVPYLVDFSPFMSETAELADIILPDVVGIERHDLASSPTSLLPWAGISYPEIRPQGEALDVRMSLKKIIEAIDGDGSKGMKRYWAFASPAQWVKKEAEATPEIKKNYKTLKSKGMWPVYGKIDGNTRQIMGKGRRPVEGRYGAYKEGGFATTSGKIEIYLKDLEEKGLPPLPAWSENKRHGQMKEGEFVLTTFKVAYQTASITTNLKFITEIWHANPLWINKDKARKLGIEDGSLVRVTGGAGYLVTKAWLTNGIHPKVVGISTSVGRTAYGRVAQAAPHHGGNGRGKLHDPDIDHNLWWRDKGVNPNDIIPVSIDPLSGVQAWNDTVVRISPAEKGDSYGDVKADNEKHMAIYKKIFETV